jgi:hypothetical protein
MHGDGVTVSVMSLPRISRIGQMGLRWRGLATREIHLAPKLRTHASLAIALLALFFALGGPSFAAGAVSDAARLLTGKQIKDGSVTGKDVKNGSLLRADFKTGQLPAGPEGPQGVQGVPGPKGDKGDAGGQGAPGTAKAYMRVNPSDTPPNSVGPTPHANPDRSKGVLSIVQPDQPVSGGNPAGVDYLFCFDLAFEPELGVASPQLANAAFISVNVLRDHGASATQIPGCPADHSDAAVATRGSDATPNDQVVFSVIFE